MFRYEVDSTGAEPEILSDHYIVVLEDRKNVHQKHSVQVVSDASAVVDLSCHELDGIPRNFFVFL